MKTPIWPVSQPTQSEIIYRTMRKLRSESSGRWSRSCSLGPLSVRRSLYLALGKLGTKVDAVPEWIFEATSVTPDVHTNRYLFDGHVRAAEMPKGWATDLMLGNLEVALFDVNPEPEERGAAEEVRRGDG